MISEFIFFEAPFQQCHASTILELSNGDLLSAWFAGSREGADDVAIWMSRREGGLWCPPFTVAMEPGTPCWNPVLFHYTEDMLWLFFKVGRSPQTWTGAYKVSMDEGRSWSGTTYLPAGLLGPAKNKPLILSNGDIICGTSVESYRAWTCWVEISSDGGETWTTHGPITLPGENFGIIQPTIVEIEPGHLRMFTRSTERIGRICEAFSEDYGKTWSPARRTRLPNPNSGIDAVRLKTGAIVLAYNHTTKSRTPLDLALSLDGGETWTYRRSLETGEGEFSYPAIIQSSDEMIHITYTWKRRRIRHVSLAEKFLREEGR